MFLPIRLPAQAPLLSGIAVTQIIGWGSAYYAPSLLVEPLGRDLGLRPAVVFAGITILLFTGATLAPFVGRHLDRAGTRGAMMLGAVVSAAGYALLACSQGPASYLACWLVVGVGHALAVASAGNVTVARLTGERARHVIGVIMLVTGFASSVFWPLAAFLCDMLGWRGAWLVFAAIQVLICLPIYACVPPQAALRPGEPVPDAAAAGAEEGRVPGPERRRVFWLAALAFSASGLVSWGLPLHLIGYLQSSGMSQATAVAIAALSGPATLAARLVDGLVGRRFPIERVSTIALALAPFASLLLAFAPVSVATGTLFVICFSAAMGVISVARATLPLSLFGPHSFGTVLGRLAVPQNLVFAAAPLLFAFLMERIGATATLAMSAAIQALALAAMLVLAGRLSRP